MQKAVEVKIMGQKVVLRSDDEEQYIRRVAEYVDGKMQEVSKSTNSKSKYSVAMLAALNIADEYHRLKDSHDMITTRVDQLIERLTTVSSDDD